MTSCTFATNSGSRRSRCLSVSVSLMACPVRRTTTTVMDRHASTLACCGASGGGRSRSTGEQRSARSCRGLAFRDYPRRTWCVADNLDVVALAVAHERGSSFFRRPGAAPVCHVLAVRVERRGVEGIHLLTAVHAQRVVAIPRCLSVFHEPKDFFSFGAHAEGVRHFHVDALIKDKSFTCAVRAVNAAGPGPSVTRTKPPGMDIEPRLTIPRQSRGDSSVSRSKRL